MPPDNVVYRMRITLDDMIPSTATTGGGAWRNWEGDEQGYFMGEKELVKVRVTQLTFFRYPLFLTSPVSPCSRWWLSGTEIR